MENFNTGLLYAGMGILVVFAVLIVLMVVIMAMQLFAKDDNKDEKAVTSPAATPSTASAAIDANETIAVISAAVAAMSGDDPNKRLRVKSIKDQNGNVLWSK